MEVKAEIRFIEKIDSNIFYCSSCGKEIAIYDPVYLIKFGTYLDIKHKKCHEENLKGKVSVCTEEEYIEYIKKENEFYDSEEPHLCTVCHKNWVDTAAGFDTCEECLKRI